MSERQITRVRDIMKTHFDTVDGMDTVESALEKMAHVETKCLVVKRRHDHDENGIVMISDIARKVLAKDRSADRINIYEIMSKPVITVDPDMDIRYAARLFTKYELSRAPVVENREIVGIVSMTDMVIKGLRRK
ncbi:MAG: CBS domain-containing protein [Sedimenticola sp.]